MANKRLLLIMFLLPLLAVGCTTRLEEARARQKEAEVQVEREHTKQYQIEADIWEFKSWIEEAKVSLERVKGDNFIKKALAQDITRQSRVYAILQLSLPVLAIVAVIVAGVVVLYILTGGRP